MDPLSTAASTSKSSRKGVATTSSLDDNGQLVWSIVWVGLVGGTASFLRTYMLNRAKGNIAARLRQQAFHSLLTQRDLEWFQLSGKEPHDEDETGDANESEEREKEGVALDGGKNPPSPTKDDQRLPLASSSSPSKKNGDDSSGRRPASSDMGMTPSAISVILKDDIDTIAHTATATVANLVRSTSSCVFGTFNMLRLNPSLVGLSLGIAPVVGMVLMYTRKYLKKVVTKQQQAELDAANFLEERLNHIAMVQLSNRQDDEVEHFGKLLQETTNLTRSSAFANGLSMGTMFTLSTTALCGILYAGGKSVKEKRMTHGELVSFGTYSFLLALGSAGVFSAMSEYMKGMVCATRLYKMIHDDTSSSTTTSTSSNKQLLSLQPQSSKKQDGDNTDVELVVNDVQSISLEKVYFTYKRNPNTVVLRNISLTVSRGEMICLVGKNGSGKSTIASLLGGLYNPTSGSILVRAASPTITSTAGSAKKSDMQSSTASTMSSGSASSSSQNLYVVDYSNELDRSRQSELVQLVPQNPALFNTTILENVRYSHPGATTERVVNALEQANCQEFVSKLEGGIRYSVGRNGSRLSGGQKQRLGLARALLSDPAVLILDEPASALDQEGESAVHQAIRACRDTANRALLVITHQAKTLELADRIVVLNDGAIVETGTLVDLKSKPDGVLRSLMRELS